jgi:hypothetical protein
LGVWSLADVDCLCVCSEEEHRKKHFSEEGRRAGTDTDARVTTQRMHSWMDKLGGVAVEVSAHTQHARTHEHTHTHKSWVV